MRNIAFVITLLLLSLTFYTCTPAAPSRPSPPTPAILPAATAPATTSPAATAPAEIPESAILPGSMTNTTRIPGRWQCSFNAHNGGFIAANADAIWFARGPNVWRYNIRQKSVDAATSPLTHPALVLRGPCALADDGSFALCSSANYLWTPRAGWSALPLAAGDPSVSSPTFDDKHQLILINHHGGFRWSAGAWNSVIDKFTIHEPLLPVEGGWLVPHTFRWFDRNLQLQHDYTPEQKNYGYIFAFYHLQGQSFAFMDTAPWDQSVFALCKITRDKFEPLGVARYIGLDLATARGFLCVPNKSRNAAAIQDLAGNLQTTIPLPSDFPEARSILLRDSNGHYWLGNRRYDGKTWSTIMPPNAFDFAGDVRSNIASNRLQFDESKSTWLDSLPNLPPELLAYNPGNHTGWLPPKPPAGDDPTPWRLTLFNPDGSQKTLQTATTEYRYGYTQPLFADSAGNWWFRAHWRWDGTKMHTYDDAWNGQIGPPAGKPDEPPQGAPDFLLGNSGRVWQYKADRSWSVYNPASDQFTSALPYDDFAFSLDHRRFAILGNPGDQNFDYTTRLGQLFEQNPDWHEFHFPFNGTFGPKPAVFAYPGKSILGSRILLSSSAGVFEWDTQSERWSYLLPFPGYWAFFDTHGRRVMVSTNLDNRIFIYTGETIAGPPANINVAASLDHLLSEMDQDSWQRRDDATRALANLLHDFPAEANRLLIARRDLGVFPPEVAMRVDRVLAAPAAPRADLGFEEKILAFRQHLGNSLFDRLCTPLRPTFPGGYVLRPDMSYPLAESILQAAGAQPAYSVDTGLPEIEKEGRGFLLPDNTAIYIILDPQFSPPRIVQLGMGPYAAGLVRGRPWIEAAKTNNLKSIQLKPNPAPIAPY